MQPDSIRPHISGSGPADLTPFSEAGFTIIDPLIPIGEIASSLGLLEIGTAGARNLLEHAWCGVLARRIRTHALVAPLLAPDSVAVQCTYFQKSAEHNWLVPMHQDLSIPVLQRVDDARLSGWSDKEGTLFVQPPDEVLGQLVAVRLHIDACGLDDGPLRVIPGSHTRGRLSSAQAHLTRQRADELSCEIQAGGALVLKPLLLHASSKATGRSRRRVLHFVFGPRYLPCGLQWHTAVE